MRICIDGVCRDMTQEEETQIKIEQRKQEVYDKHRLLTEQEVFNLVISKTINTLGFDDNVSLKMIHYYPTWEDLINQGVQLTSDNFENFKFTYHGKLYKVIQPHTFSSAWVPGVGTESLYVRIDEEHNGDLYDPIPYESNIILEKDKYYTQNDVVYKCINGSGIAVYAESLSSFIHLYVEVIDITSL